MKLKYILAAVVVLAGTPSTSARAADAIVRPNQLHQRITGFGASSAWSADFTDAEADLLFTTDSGVGLTLLRLRIPPDGCTQDDCGAAAAVKAQARGATVWAAPWSPPAAWKSNGDVDNGGTLLPEHADDWANALVAYVQWMQTQGVTISKLSGQNEPTTKVSYESCIYTPSALADFIGNHLGPALHAANLDTTKIVAPETQDWQTFPTFASAILSSSAASSAVGVLATHSYGQSAPAAYPAADQANKELWQTEVYDQAKHVDAGIASGIRVALMMHSALVEASVNAWHYWWILPVMGNAALFDQASDAPAKRLYAMGNFSRFVRPGFYRVDTTTTGPTPGVSISAYADGPSKQIVIVVINENAGPVSQAILFDGVAAGSWMSWVTSSTKSSVSSGSPVDGGSNPNELVVSLDPQSVTTFRGLVTGPGPKLPAIPDPPDAPGGGPGCACSTPARRPDGMAAGVALAAILAAAWRGRRKQAGRGA